MENPMIFEERGHSTLLDRNPVFRNRATAAFHRAFSRPTSFPPAIGEPFGFVRCTRKSNRRVFATKPLSEYADDPVPGLVLHEICNRMADNLERQFGIYVKR